MLTEEQKDEVREISKQLKSQPSSYVKAIIATATAVGALAGGTGLYGGKTWAESEVRNLAKEEAQNTLDKSERIKSIEEDSKVAAQESRENSKRLDAVSRNQCQLMEYLNSQDSRAPRCAPADTH